MASVADNRLAEVTGWLTRYGLEQYMPMLKEEGFDQMTAIKELTADDLASMNVKRGHRKMFTTLIAHYTDFHKKRMASGAAATGVPTATPGATPAAKVPPTAPVGPQHHLTLSEQQGRFQNVMSIGTQPMCLKWSNSFHYQKNMPNSTEYEAKPATAIINTKASFQSFSAKPDKKKKGKGGTVEITKNPHQAATQAAQAAYAATFAAATAAQPSEYLGSAGEVKRKKKALSPYEFTFKVGGGRDVMFKTSNLQANLDKTKASDKPETDAEAKSKEKENADADTSTATKPAAESRPSRGRKPAEKKKTDAKEKEPEKEPEKEETTGRRKRAKRDTA